MREGLTVREKITSWAAYLGPGAHVPALMASVCWDRPDVTVSYLGVAQNGLSAGSYGWVLLSNFRP
jgi:hypothetical protein